MVITITLIALFTLAIIVPAVNYILVKRRNIEYKPTINMENLKTNEPDVQNAYENTVMSCMSQQSQSKMNRSNAPTKIYNQNEIDALMETKNETTS